MIEYKKGTKFKVCNFDELIQKGWSVYFHHYEHADYKGWYLSEYIIDQSEGKTLTVDCVHPMFILQKKWYNVEENEWIWPVATFLETDNELDHICEEGMTAIDGWFICKICGTDLRTLK